MKDSGMKNKETGISRRNFIACGTLLGTAAAAAPLEALTGNKNAGREKGLIMISQRPDKVIDPKTEDILYSVCLQCNTGCGIKCRLQNGVLTKIDGNPYNPWTMVPHLSYTTHSAEAAAVDGAVCPKGQSGLQTAYDPYRLRKVLKRIGKRGENKWRTIPFAQAIREICEGGRLFTDVPGEENRLVQGLRELLVLTDPAAAEEMAADVKSIWNEKNASVKKKMVEAFKKKHAVHLDKLIDPDHPDLGPKNNQIVLNWGRVKGGRGDFYKRFGEAMGTVNAHGHTTVCQGSLYFTCKAISEQYSNGQFSGGKKFYWQADTENSRFVLFVGSNLFEANYGPTNRTVRLTENLASGHTRIAVADPRFGSLASKAWKWLPLHPGTDIPLAMAFLNWLFANKGYNAAFLAAANKGAALEAGEKSWTNSTWLVCIQDGIPGKLLRAGELGLAAGHELVAMVDGSPVPVDPDSISSPVKGDLFVSTVLNNGTEVKSGLEILRETAQQKSFNEWCALAGVKPADVAAVASELAQWGSRAAVDIHRGPAQHTNGFYAVLAWMNVNMLLGNFDHKGGMIAPAAWDTRGKGGLFDMNSHPGSINPFGISSIRHDIDYEKTTLFSGYPAKRNWYPLASDVYQEVIPSIADAYPYPVKVLFQYMAAPTYALPAGHTNISALLDLEKLPLFISNDIIIGTTSMYADYIFPDVSFLERWEFQGTHPNIPSKVQPVRQPVIAPIPENCTVFGQTLPLSFESMMLGIAEYLKLPGFGEDGLGKGMDFKHPDDYYLRMAANLAFGEKTDGTQKVPDADEREMEIFLKSRRHLPKSVFDHERWRKIVGHGMWPKVVYVLNRGGRFQDHKDGYSGDMVTNAYGALLNLYQEKTAGTIHSGTGKPFPGFASNVEIEDYHGKKPDALRDGYGLKLITNRVISQCKTRTITNPWLSVVMPENGIVINPEDAATLNIKNGDTVKVVSATNPDGEWLLGNGNRKAMTGKAIVSPTIRPGVVTFALGFGNWATGASDIIIDGHTIKGEKRRGAGIHANAAMWIDPALGNTCMFDPIGGSVSFYDTYVNILKV